MLCEKPIALKAEEIDGLIALRDRTGLVAAEAFMVTHHPQWIRARELVRQGAIGRLRQVQGAFTFFNEDPGNIRNRADMGGGALRDIGVYPSISTRFVTGEEPTAVTLRRDRVGPRHRRHRSGGGGVPELRHGLLRLDAHGAAADHDLPRRQRAG